MRIWARTVYPALVDRCPVVESGAARLPDGAGIGARFHDALFAAGSNEFRRSTR